MKIIVLGAGISGITTAWFLQNQGHEVTVIDRQSGASQETSFANGGQISVSHAEPWANPYAPLKILKWLGKEDAPLLYKFQNDPQQWKWCLQFLRECTPNQTAKNIKQIVTLAEYSRVELGKLRAKTGIEYDHLVKGILHFYTDKKEFNDSLKAAQLMRELGCPRISLSGNDEVIKIEPSLSSISDSIVGGDFTHNDESGDVYKFTTNLAKLCREKGVHFKYNTTITRLIKNGNKIEKVEIIDGHGKHKTESADAFVVCMGSFVNQILNPIGINLMIYPGKGYSATYEITNPDKAPTVSLTDDGYKLVFSRLGGRLRVAGTCELNGYTRELNPARCEAITRRTRELFPDACDYSKPVYWTGLRPLTPSNVPYIGQTKYNNLYLNGGHGTLGWTNGVGSGKAISQIITYGESELDFNFTKN